MSKIDQSQDVATFSRPAHLPGVELISFSYFRRDFPFHAHPEYVIGAVVGGAERLCVRGGSHSLGVGSTLFLQPDEPHSNSTIGAEPLRYRGFYIPAESMARWLPDEAGLPGFVSPASHSPGLHRLLTNAHRRLRLGGDALEQEETLAEIAAALASAEIAGTELKRPRFREAIARAKDYLDSRHAEPFRLSELAEIARLSPFHLLRSFRSEVGLTPLAYRNQRRVAEARRLLKGTRPIAEIALEVGFADQSHLTRHFQRIVGVSPGRYREQ
ncbi:AraC family transcriptional regulator [Sphingosinicella sp. CPCC 101087]|uniref:AraC family transcriptional regulator n=1 Tax=Sphingosinicella sp. CPCC 101087 TaxID=2497754 RepID=UPI00101C412E|nr:AraC family transcriptional regulator [Sphingosinicella sp. CPCC 101087]